MRQQMRRHRQAGYVLALNIAVLALLLVAATFVGQSVSEAVALARLHRENLQTEIRLESARSRVLYLYSAAPRSTRGLGDGTDTLALDGRAYAAGDDILVSFQDLRGLVPLNGPSLSTPSNGRVERLLGTYGLDAAKATSLAEALLDYRDGDAFRRLNGAEESDYRQMGKAGAIRNKDLLDPQEVGRVFGWRDAAMLWGNDPVTDHLSSLRGMQFNPNTATWRTLVAASGLDEKTARELVQRRQSGEIADLTGLVFGGDVGDPFGSNAFVISFPSASAIIVLRAHGAQWGIKLKVHHSPVEVGSPWRVEVVRRVSLPPPDKPYKDYPQLPELKALKTRVDSGQIKLPF